MPGVPRSREASSRSPPTESRDVVARLSNSTRSRYRSATTAGSIRRCVACHRRCPLPGARPADDRPVHHARSGAAPSGVPRRLRRDLPRLQRARFRRRQLDRRLVMSSRCTRRDPTTARPMFTDCHDAASATTLLTFDDGTVGVVSQHPLQRSRLRPAASNCTAAPTASSPAGTRDRRCATSTPGEAYPPGPAHQFFMDRFADAYRAELATFLAGRDRCDRPLRAHLPRRLEVAWIAEAATQSLREHRPVRMAEIRTSHTR